MNKLKLLNIAPKFLNRSFIFQKRNLFGTIRMVSQEGVIDRSTAGKFNPQINWELAKVWVNPHFNSTWNSLTPQSRQNESNEVCLVAPVGKVKQMDFDRFLRKVGLIMSGSKDVFVQDGVYKSKKVRIVSSDKEDAAAASAIFESKGDFQAADVYVLHNTSNNEVGTGKRFVLYDNKTKTIISNTKNLANLTSVIENIGAEEKK